MYRKAIAFLALCALPFASCLCETVDAYRFTATLKVPRVYSNTESLGYRKYQTQRVKGYVFVTYVEGRATFAFSTMTNLTHKVGGSCVTYECYVNTETLRPRFNYIGDNGRNVFKTPTASLFVEMYPSYAKAEAQEDNSLYLMMSGYGSSFLYNGTRIPKTVKGYVAGNVGCGCTEYGHKSPTRVIGECGASESVDDVCPVFGSFTMTYDRKRSVRTDCSAIICK